MSIFELGVTLFTGFMLVGIGFFVLKRGFTFFSSSDQLWKNITRWRVFSDTSPSPQMLEDIKQSWCYLRAMMLIGGGIGILLLGICIAALSLVTTGTLDGNGSGNAMFFLAIAYIYLFVGLGLGGIFAVWHLRRVAKRKVTYADLRRRRLSDYRGKILPWIPLVAMVETVAFSWFFAPHLGATLRFIQLDGTTVNVPNNLWMLSIVPAVIIVLSVLAEFLMRRLTRLSRLVITSDTTVSQRADDMLRASVISMVQVYELTAVFYLGILQSSIVMNSLWASGYWQMGNRPYNLLANAFFGLLFLTLVIGGGLAALRSPLGGNLSRWPWQTKQDAAIGDPALMEEKARMS
jgi:hypothetical protein